MSLLQRALDRAENSEAEITEEKEVLQTASSKVSIKEKKGTSDMPKPSAVIPAVHMAQPRPETKHEAPRLNAIRFYESQNEAVEKDIQATVKTHAVSLPAVSEETAQGTTRNFAALIFLLLILSLGAVRFIAPSSGKTKSQEPVVNVPRSETSQTVVVKAEKPFIAKPVSQIKFLLTGITSSDDALLALINNQVVGTGDKLREGATVKSITANRVVLDLDGKQIVLNF